MLNAVNSDLASLMRWADEADTKIECSRVGRSHVVLSRKGERLGFFQWIARFFSWTNPEVNRYGRLRKVLKRILEDENSETKNVEKVFKKIRAEFLSLRDDTSVVATIQANDLLEAYATAHSYDRFKKIAPRIRADAMAPSCGSDIESATQKPLRIIGEISDKALLLVEYGKISNFVDEVDRLRVSGGPLTRESIKNLLEKRLLKFEDVPMGKMIDVLYRHRFPSRHDLEKLITQIAVWKFGSASMVRDVKKTVKFFRNLHIDLWLNVRGKLYSFSEVFGYDIRDAKSFQESFTRPLTEAIEKRLLKKFEEKRVEVREILGESPQVICSTAFARNTVMECAQGSIQKPRSIRGKVISETSPPPDEIGYAEAVPFTVFDLFGAYVPPSLDTVAEPISEDPSGVKKSARAQGALLGAMASFVDQHDTTLVVQRLAPSDIHHFYATADARVLTRKECCKELQEQIKKKVALGLVSTEEDRKQIAALQKLEAFFQEDSVSTINISGTTLSPVNGVAMRRESAILATNDRKIMMVRHSDESVAFHVFIGATVINSIGVTVPAGEVRAGKDFGWMGYGSQEKEGWITAGTYQPAPVSSLFILSWPRRLVVWVLNFLSALRSNMHSLGRRGIHVASGAPAGSFGPGGSTVISIYLDRDYALAPEVRKFVGVATKEVTGKPPETIEFQSQLGDVLATPLAYQTIRLMKALSIEVPTKNPLKSLRELHQKLLSVEDPSIFEKKWLRILNIALQRESESLQDLCNKVQGDDRHMLELFSKAITEYIPI